MNIQKIDNLHFQYKNSLRSNILDFKIYLKQTICMATVDVVTKILSFIDCLVFQKNCKKLIFLQENSISFTEEFNKKYKNYLDSLKGEKKLKKNSENFLNQVNLAKSFIAGMLYENNWKEDTYIDKESQKLMLKNNKDMNKSYNQKDLERLKSQYIYENKLKLLKNSYSMAKKSLEKYLDKHLPELKRTIINNFISDFLNISNRTNQIQNKSVQHKLNIDCYNPHKNETYKKIFTFLTENNFNYLLVDENDMKYYSYVHDIIFLKYKMQVILYANDIQKLDPEKDINYKELKIFEKTIKMNSSYDNFFQYIKNQDDINTYLLQIINGVNGNNEIKDLLHIVHGKKGDKYKLNTFKIFSLFPNMLEKSSPIIAFKLFQKTKQFNF